MLLLFDTNFKLHHPKNSGLTRPRLRIHEQFFAFSLYRLTYEYKLCRIQETESRYQNVFSFDDRRKLELYTLRPEHTYSSLHTYSSIPNIPLHPLLQQNKASLPRSIQFLDLKISNIHLQIIQQPPRHVVAWIKIQVRVAGLVYAHLRPHESVSAWEGETTVLRAVCQSFVAAYCNIQVVKWGSVSVKLDGQGRGFNVEVIRVGYGSVLCQCWSRLALKSSERGLGLPWRSLEGQVGRRQ